MQKRYIECASCFFIGGVLSSVASVLVVKHLVDKKEKERTELDEKFRNNEFAVNEEYLNDLARYYRAKSNRAKIQKKSNDVKKFDYISKVLFEKAKEIKKETKKYWK